MNPHLAATLFLIASTASAADGTWAFAPGPDPFRDDAVLDLRGLNEAVAGERGFVRADAQGDFIDGAGRPIRFWAVNSAVHEKAPEPGGLDRHMRFLAKLGVNMVRSLQSFYGVAKGRPGITGHAAGPDPLAVNPEEVDAIWRLVASARKQGIYVNLAPYWAMPLKVPASWGIAGKDGQNAQGLLFFNATMRDSYKAWLRQILTPPNPHTGISLKDDPALAILELQNEDSLLFWTFNGMDPEQKKELGRQFATWAAGRHGSVAQALEAWGGPRAAEGNFPGDDAAGGTLGLISVYDFTANAPPAAGGKARRMAEQLEFVSSMMRDFNAEMVRYLRQDLGVRCLINAGNWKTADAGTLNDCERWSYLPGDTVAVNRYYSGIHQGDKKLTGWAIVPGDRYTEVSVLRNPADLPINVKQVAGRPMLVTESEWVPPSAQHRAEGPALIAAYSALSGVDAYFWFTFGHEEWRQPGSANGHLKNSITMWNVATPDVAALFPAAALMLRNGYIRRGTTVIHEERALADLWERKPALLYEKSGFDPNRDAGEGAVASAASAAASPLSYLVGPVEVVYGGDPAKTVSADLGERNDLRKRIVTANTGELSLDYGRQVLTIDAPSAQGVVGFLQDAGGAFATRDIRFRSADPYAAALVVAMDGKPIATSQRVLVQVGTQCHPTGWAVKPAQITAKGAAAPVPGYEITSVGTAPWQVVDSHLSLTIANPGLRTATRLDAQGYAAGPVAVTATADGVQCDMPRDALYLVLTR